MRTWFQRAGVRVLVAGAGLVVLSAAFTGCGLIDKQPAKPATTQARQVNGFNGAANATGNQAANSQQTQNGSNRTAQSMNTSDPSRGIGMNSGPMNPTSPGAAGQQQPQNQVQFGQPPYNQQQSNANGTGAGANSNRAVIATSNSNRATAIQQAGASQVTMTGVQPDPTPGSGNVPAPVTTPYADRQIQRYSPDSPPRMTTGATDPSIQPVTPANWQK
jgi:hypothetical protein